MIFIDFYGGTHGNFLEFLIERFVFDMPEYKNFLPFTKTGTAHIKPTASVKNCFASHYSFDDSKEFILNNVKSTDFLVRIKTNTNNVYYTCYNSHQRAGDIELDFDNLEIDSFKKFSNRKFNKWLNYVKFDKENNASRKDLRNILYAQLREDAFLKFVNEFKIFQIDNILEYNISNFYNYELLVEMLNDISTKVTGKHIDQTNLLEVWELFISKVDSVKSKDKVDNLYSDILNDISIDIKLNLIEESYLNVLITKQFHIHSDITIFDNLYPTNTQVIASEIKQVMKNRNNEFDLTIPLGLQLNKIKSL